MKKNYLYGLTGLLILASAGYLFVSNSNGKDIKYRTEKASRGSIVVQVRATGTISPVKTVDVGSQVSGIIEKLYVDFNSQVKQGEVIAQLDSTFLNASVKEAEANMDHARAIANKAERDYERTKGLAEKNLVAQADIDAAK